MIQKKSKCDLKIIKITEKLCKANLLEIIDF